METKTMTFKLRNGCGTVTLPVDKIREMEHRGDHVMLGIKGGGLFYVELAAAKRSELYRLLADIIDHEEAEAVTTEKTIQ